MPETGDPAAVVAEILNEGFRGGLEAAARAVELLHERMPCTATFQSSAMAAAIRALDPAKPPAPAAIVRREPTPFDVEQPLAAAPVDTIPRDLPCEATTLAPAIAPAQPLKLKRVDVQARNAEIARRILAGDNRRDVAAAYGVSIHNTYVIAPASGGTRRPRPPRRRWNDLRDDGDSGGELE